MINSRSFMVGGQAPAYQDGGTVWLGYTISSKLISSKLMYCFFHALRAAEHPLEQIAYAVETG